MEIIREKLENGKTRAWVKRTPEEIEELKKKIEELKKKIEELKNLRNETMNELQSSSVITES